MSGYSVDSLVSVPDSKICYTRYGRFKLEENVYEERLYFDKAGLNGTDENDPTAVDLPGLEGKWIYSIAVNYLGDDVILKQHTCHPLDVPLSPFATLISKQEYVRVLEDNAKKIAKLKASSPSIYNVVIEKPLDEQIAIFRSLGVAEEDIPSLTRG